MILKGGWYNTFLTLNGDLTVLSGASSAETLAVKGKLIIQGGSLQANGVEVQ